MIDKREGNIHTHTKGEKMKNTKSLDRVKKEFEEIVDVINAKFGVNYASKNPGLVQHLMGTIQALEDRDLKEHMNGVSR